MGYDVIDPESIEPTPERPSTRRSISDAAGLEKVGCHLFEAAPGEQVPLSYHYHDEQEEAFYVLEGTLSVETPDRTYAVEAGEAFVAEPESPHRAFNDSSADGDVRLLAIGAPRVDDAHSLDDDS